MIVEPPATNQAEGLEHTLPGSRSPGLHSTVLLPVPVPPHGAEPGITQD